MTYEHARQHILAVMDVKTTRLEIVAERERQGLNQRELAAKAGLDQGHMSKIEDIDGQEMRDLAARIVFQIIERGLGLTVSEFFARIEGLPDAATTSDDHGPSEVSPADDALSTPEGRTYYAIGKAIASIVTRVEREGRESQRGPHRRHPPAIGNPPAPSDPHPRRPRTRTPQRRPRKRP